MRKLLLSILSFGFVSAFSQYNDVAPGLTKEKHRKLIIQKMDVLMNRVSAETGCPKTDIKYTQIDYVSCSSKDNSKKLPQTIVIDACGQKLTYVIDIPYCTVDSWCNATKWLLNSTSKKQE